MLDRDRVIATAGVRLSDLAFDMGALRGRPAIAEGFLVRAYCLSVFRERVAIGRETRGVLGRAKEIQLGALPLLGTGEVKCQDAGDIVEPVPIELFERRSHAVVQDASLSVQQALESDILREAAREGIGADAVGLGPDQPSDFELIKSSTTIESNSYENERPTTDATFRTEARFSSSRSSRAWRTPRSVPGTCR